MSLPEELERMEVFRSQLKSAMPFDDPWDRVRRRPANGLAGQPSLHCRTDRSKQSAN
jgi:hypothetical protein